MKPLPLPVRVAAGLAVIAVDRARHLPEKLTELPVTMVSHALQLSMRLQQQVTELAIRGDGALATFRPVEESPGWATFDEDAAGDQYDVSASAPATTNGARSRFDSVTDAELNADVDADAEAEIEADEDSEPAAAQDPWAEEERAMLSELDGSDEDRLAPSDSGERASTPHATRPNDREPGHSESTDKWESAHAPADDLPSSVPHYPGLTLPQLRARLRRLDTDQLTELLGYETEHADRPEFVGMLTRRIATLRDQQ